MGLDTSHDCWHSSYNSFMSWRRELAKAAGMPELKTMVGFGGDTKWESLDPSPLHILLNHSDCEGEIRWQDCNAIATELQKLLPKLTDWYFDVTVQFIAGLHRAAKAQENVDFH